MHHALQHELSIHAHATYHNECSRCGTAVEKSMKKRSRTESIFGQSARKNPHDSGLRSSSNQHKCTMSKAAREAAPSPGPYLIRACDSALEGGAVQSVVGSEWKRRLRCSAEVRQIPSSYRCAALTSLHCNAITVHCNALNCTR